MNDASPVEFVARLIDFDGREEMWERADGSRYRVERSVPEPLSREDLDLLTRVSGALDSYGGNMRMANRSRTRWKATANEVRALRDRLAALLPPE